MSATASKYVKVCPQCNAVSDESEMLCKGCGNYLGGVSITALSNLPGQEATAKGEAECHIECLSTGKCFKIRSGDVVGQAHPSSDVRIQLDGIPGVEYISRRHCRFDFHDDAWFVTALEDVLNPTFYNRVRMAPGGQVRVRDGGILTLAAASFRVRTG